MENNSEILQRLDTIERKLAERERQQITFPLDDLSVKVLQKYFMRLLRTIITVGGAGGNTFVEYAGVQDDKKFVVSADPYISYIVDTTADTLTVERGGFEDGTSVYLVTEDSVPAPLVGGTEYFVVNATNGGKTFQISATFGGSAINITNTGSGKQYIFLF